jgi:hypothetical protein
MPLSQATLNALRQRQQSTAARTAQYSGRPAPVANMQSPTVQPPMARGPMGPQMGQNPMASPYPPYMGPKMPQQMPMPQQQMQNPYQQQMAAQQALDQSKQQQMFNAMASPTYNGQLGMGNMAMPQMPQGSMDMPIRQDMSSMGMPPAGPAYGLRAGPMDMPQQAMGQQGPSMDMLRQALGNYAPMPQQGLGGMAAGIGGVPAFGQQNFGMPPPTEQSGNFAQNQFPSNSASPPAFAQSGLQSLLGGGMGGGLAQQQGMQGMQQMTAQPQQTPSFSGGLGGGMGGMQQGQPQQQSFFGQAPSGGSPGGGNAGLF